MTTVKFDTNVGFPERHRPQPADDDEKPLGTASTFRSRLLSVLHDLLDGQ